MKRSTLFLGVLVATAFAAACKQKNPPRSETMVDPMAPAVNLTPKDEGVQECAFPTVKIAVSEYPSWSTYFVADMRKRIGAKEGSCGPIERQYGVDIVVLEGTYVPTLDMYANGVADAVTVTNMDALALALGRPGEFIFATSTSYGGDAVLVPQDVTDVKQLRGKTCYGPEQSVSEYLWIRGLELKGEDPTQYTFKNMDPEPLSTAMIQGSITCGVLWQPLLNDTLKQAPGLHELFNSTVIPAEIVDAVLIARTTLEQPYGPKAAQALAATFYDVVGALNDPATAEQAHLQLAVKFAPALNFADMREVRNRTRFYETSEASRALFSGGTAFPFVADVTSESFPQNIMPRVVKLWVSKGYVSKEPTIAYGASGPGTQLRFNPVSLE